LVKSQLLYQLSYRGSTKNGGGGEIRTLGRLLTYASFQDWCIKPLCHPSAEEAHITVFSWGVNRLLPIFNLGYAAIYTYSVQTDSTPAAPGADDRKLS
tara:strand:+ start:182 stop:475 length:294 start_codon:yes stop_codon:yes gene_type:complete